MLLVAAAALFSSLMSYVQQYIIATVGEELTLSLRQDVSAKLNRLPLRYFDGHKTGDIVEVTLGAWDGKRCRAEIV